MSFERNTGTGWVDQTGEILRGGLDATRLACRGR